jgi:hypothetical protein
MGYSEHRACRWPRSTEGDVRTRGLEKGREVECRSWCCRRKSTSRWSLKLHIEVRSEEAAWRAAAWYYGGAHFASRISSTVSQCGQPAGVPLNRQWRGVMGVSTHAALMCRLIRMRPANHSIAYPPEDWESRV